jgi:uncharacterized protein GlcG (DUF336 family)
MISNKKDMSSKFAVKMAQAALDYAIDEGWEITVAVCDGSGILVAFMKTDNVIPAAVDFALDKAFTAATLRKATHEFGERMSSASGLSLGVGTRNRLITWTGGIPIFDGQDCVGGIGVSGAMDHQDLECADAALKSVGLKDAPNKMAEH